MAHGTTSDADTIRDTAVAQPLLVATALLTLRALLAVDGGSLTDVDPVAGVVAAPGRTSSRATPWASSAPPRSPAC